MHLVGNVDFVVKRLLPKNHVILPYTYSMDYGIEYNKQISSTYQCIIARSGGRFIKFYCYRYLHLIIFFQYPQITSQSNELLHNLHYYKNYLIQEV
jgi:hypothetical protein